MTLRDTLPAMSRPISVRLDEDALRALRVLEATGLTRSDAVRTSLLAAADRVRRAASLGAEVAALDADAGDRREMAAVAELMEALRAPG